MLQIVRLAVALVEPDEDAEDLGVALRRHDGIGLAEGRLVERAGGLARGDIGVDRRLLDLRRDGHARILASEATS